MAGRLGDGPIGVALGQVAADDDLLPLVLERLRHGPAGYRAGLVEGLSCAQRSNDMNKWWVRNKKWDDVR